jgi:hypothetical protein
MNLGIKRLFWIGTGMWFAWWAWVAWRGHSLEQDALSYIDAVGAGGHIPPVIISALEAGQSYQRLALLFGVVAPIVLLVVLWVRQGFQKSRGQSSNS